MLRVASEAGPWFGLWGCWLRLLKDWPEVRSWPSTPIFVVSIPPFQFSPSLPAFGNSFPSAVVTKESSLARIPVDFSLDDGAVNAFRPSHSHDCAALHFHVSYVAFAGLVSLAH